MSLKPALKRPAAARPPRPRRPAEAEAPKAVLRRPARAQPEAPRRGRPPKAPEPEPEAAREPPAPVRRRPAAAEAAGAPVLKRPARARPEEAQEWWEEGLASQPADEAPPRRQSGSRPPRRRPAAAETSEGSSSSGCSAQFRDMLDRHAIASIYKQLHLSDIIGSREAAYEAVGGRKGGGLVHFGKDLTFKAEALGVEAVDGSFTWAWAAKGLIPGLSASQLRSAQAMRSGEGWSRGEAAPPEFTEGMVPKEHATGKQIAAVASGLLGVTAYALTPLTASGSTVMLIVDRNFPPRSPQTAGDALRVSTSIQQALSTGWIQNHAAAAVLAAMDCDEEVKYIGMQSLTTLEYARRMQLRYGLELPAPRTVAGLKLVPQLLWYDKPHFCRAAHYREVVLRDAPMGVCECPERRYGVELMWPRLRTAGDLAREHRQFGTFFLDVEAEVVYHLSGRKLRSEFSDAAECVEGPPLLAQLHGTARSTATFTAVAAERTAQAPGLAPPVAHMQSSRFKGRCFICGAKGHSKLFCPKRADGPLDLASEPPGVLAGC